MIFQGDQEEATNTDGTPPDAIEQIEYETTNRDNNNDPTPETVPKRKKLTKTKVKEVAACIQELQSLANTMQDADHSEKDDEFHIFGQSVAVQLKKLPLDQAISCQNELQGILTRYRLASIPKNQNTTSTLTTVTPVAYTSVSIGPSSSSSLVSAYSESEDYHNTAPSSHYSEFSNTCEEQADHSILSEAMNISFGHNTSMQ